jgi:hypothetical protein
VQNERYAIPNVRDNCKDSSLRVGRAARKECEQKTYNSRDSLVVTDERHENRHMEVGGIGEWFSIGNSGELMEMETG